MLDALTFWANGFKNVTCLFGTEGFTDELWEACEESAACPYRLRCGRRRRAGGAAGHGAFSEARHRSFSGEVPARHGRQRVRLQSETRRQIAGLADERGAMGRRTATSDTTAAESHEPRARAFFFL